MTASVDLSQRFGAADAFGVRVNAAAAHLDPKVRDATGAAAACWPWPATGASSADTLIEAEIETSRRSQPSVPGFSLLGDSVPAPGDPRINLNNQPWSLPVVFDGDTASLRWRQKLADGWRFTAHAATQRLRSDDRIAFPFGWTAARPAASPASSTATATAPTAASTSTTSAARTSAAAPMRWTCRCRASCAPAR